MDTTLLGFHNMSWQRGNQSFVFKGRGDSRLHTRERGVEGEGRWEDEEGGGREDSTLNRGERDDYTLEEKGRVGKERLMVHLGRERREDGTEEGPGLG